MTQNILENICIIFLEYIFLMKKYIWKNKMNYYF